MIRDHKVTYNFHKSNNIFSKGIRLVTRTQRFNHVSITVGGKTFEAKVNPFKGVCSFEGAHKGTISYSEWIKNPLNLIHKVEVEVTKEQYDNILAFLESYIGHQEIKLFGIFTLRLPKTPYDYLAIIGFLVNSNIQNKKALYCNEYGSKSFEKITYRELTRKTNLSPDDFYLMVLYFNIGRGFNK